MAFSILANFWFGLVRFSHFNTVVFRFWCLARFAGFLQFSLCFSVFANNDGSFSDFLPSAFYGFPSLAKKFTLRSRAKTVVPRE